MRITDAVVHVWEASRQDEPSDSSINPHLPAPLTLESLEKAMSEAKVDRVVMVPPRGEDHDITAVNQHAFTIARSQPDRFAVMARIDADRPDVQTALAVLMSRPEMKGFRLNPRWESLGAVDWIWPEAVRTGMPVAVHPKGERLSLLLPIIERHPELHLLIDHAGLPAVGPDPFANLDQVLALARYENVVVKLSGMTRYSKEAYPFRDIHRHIHRLYDAFGPQRLAWGSDYSWEVGRITYREAVDLFREACDFMSSSDREWILDKTLARVLRWDD